MTDKASKPMIKFFRRRLEEMTGLILCAAGIGMLAAFAGVARLAFLSHWLTVWLGMVGWAASLILISLGWAMFFHHARIWRAWRVITLLIACAGLSIFLAGIPSQNSALFFEGLGGLAGQKSLIWLKAIFPQYIYLIREFAFIGAAGAFLIFAAALPIRWRRFFIRQKASPQENNLSPLIKNLQKNDLRTKHSNGLKQAAQNASGWMASQIRGWIHFCRRAGAWLKNKLMHSRKLAGKFSPAAQTARASLAPQNDKPAPQGRSFLGFRKKSAGKKNQLPGIKKSGRKTSRKLPSRALIEAPAMRRKERALEPETEKRAMQLDVALKDFNIKGEISNISPGPVVTLFEFKPAPGVKSSRVIGLADDIARSMSALSARISVIPGRNALGIEIPNQHRETVHLDHLISSQVYKNTRYNLPLILGTAIDGAPIVADLAAMPHLLVAGTTGSGKSMAINTMILSLLYRLRADECRMIMIDPKMLELSVYQDIPHLLTPVVTEPKKAVAALRWIVKEMEARYRKMSEINVRNIANYNQKISSRNELMPFIIVIIDEMADLMMVAGKEIEAAVQRLAQMARAAGIHLIAATQRPSVDVITGTIKANFPTRISFQVTSRIDSRTILGESGGEQLLGRGDMLFMMGGGKPQRIHGPFISDDHVEQVAEFLRQNSPIPDYLEDITQTADPSDGNLNSAAGAGDDDLYAQAINIVGQNERASTSFLQRKLQIGYNRAARLIERMEEEGIVSAPNHAGKRQILHNFQEGIRKHG